MTQLLYPNGNDVTHLTKEAIASSIVHRIYDQLRGAGSTGRIIYREKPSKVIHTQHLLPRRKPSLTATTYAEKDDVTSPAHIGTAGLTFQIADRTDRAITVGIRASIYVRMLPSRKDLASSKVVFRLAKNARSVILRHRREALRRAEDENRATLGEQGRKSTAWLEIKNRAIEQAENAALRELGIAPDVLTSPARQEALISILDEQDEEPAADDPAANNDPQASSAEALPAEEANNKPTDAVDAVSWPDRGPAVGDSDTLRAFEFEVGPSTTNAPPVALIEREQIPQKWFRLDVDLGALKLDLSQGAEATAAAVFAFNAEMQRRIEQAIDSWLADDDPDNGGLFWAFPAGRGMQSPTITPADVVSWDQTLVNLRNNRVILPSWSTEMA
jgi:hypothetical protein